MYMSSNILAMILLLHLLLCTNHMLLEKAYLFSASVAFCSMESAVYALFSIAYLLSVVHMGPFLCTAYLTSSLFLTPKTTGDPNKRGCVYDKIKNSEQVWSGSKFFNELCKAMELQSLRKIN